MFSWFVAPLLLMASPAPSFQSELVEVGHAHAWDSVYSADNNTLWIDRYWNNSIKHGGKTYPEMLVRGLNDAGENQVYTEFKMVLDCSNQKIAVTKIWLKASPNRPAEIFTAPELTFDGQDKMPNLMAAKLLNAACENIE